jgi:hypothetical protein
MIGRIALIAVLLVLVHSGLSAAHQLRRDNRAETSGTHTQQSWATA